MAAQVAKLGAEVIAYDAIHHKDSIHLAGRGEDFATGKIAPLFRTDEATGLEPLVIGIELCD